MFVFASSTISSGRPERIVRVAYRVNPLICSNVSFGGIDSSWRAVTMSITAGPLWAKASRSASSSVASRN